MAELLTITGLRRSVLALARLERMLPTNARSLGRRPLLLMSFGIMAFSSFLLTVGLISLSVPILFVSIVLFVMSFGLVSEFPFFNHAVINRTMMFITI